ncbi:MAG: hypothetical protein IJS45_03295 [Clostridia bacterium]|nr:hypothetical protein [Clostridia bacterium]
MKRATVRKKKRRVAVKDIPAPKRKRSRKSGKKRPEKEGGFYRFAIPLLMLISTAGAVLIWSYSTDTFGNSFKGFSDDGRLVEVYLAFLKDPVILLTVLGLLLFDIASFISVVRAIREKKSGAAALMVLLLISVAAFAAIIITAVTQAAS